MPDASTSDLDEELQGTSVINVSGGVNLDAQRDVTIGGDVVGRDKITSIGYTVEQVSTLLAQISTTFQPKPFDGRCPYLGLDYFSEDDADRFFGRETLVSELVARVEESRFVVIAGPSGSGKSSLVRAGLLHQLKHSALPNSDRWLYATLTPGRDPIESLALALSRMAKSPDAGKYLREHSAESGALHEFVESQLSDRKDQRAIIFVDQFEEVFTQVSKEGERVAFLNLLADAATRKNGRVTVLFAMRSDFVSNCATYPQLNALLNQQFMQVGAMQPDELVSAIARPALQVGLRIDPDLVAQIVNDMQDEPGALPLMQFALKDLFDAQQAKGGVIALTLNDYLVRGGLRKALERHADAAFAKLSESEQRLACTIFSGLIEIGRGTQDTRRTAMLAELVPANMDAAQVEVVVQKLADARLITTDEQDHHVTVTIAHETLIDAWPWLRKLINENREAISLKNRIAEDAQEWYKHRRESSYLYSGARLATAREELAGQRIVLSGPARRFITASVEAEESTGQREKERQQQEIRRLRTRNRIITTVGLVALFAMVVAVFFSVQSNQNADIANRNAATAQAASTKAVSETNTRATAQAEALAQRDEVKRQVQIALSLQLASQSISVQEHNLDLALLLSLEALRIANTAEARSSLLNEVQANPRLAAFLQGHTDLVSSVAFSPDGKTLASGSRDNTVILWDVSNPRAPVPLGTPLDNTSWTYAVAFSPNGKTLASGTGDGDIILWDISNPRSPTQLSRPSTKHASSVLSVAFNPDGMTLASGSSDNTVILWDVSNPRLPLPLGTALAGHTAPVDSVAFSPDGKVLASGSMDTTVILWDVSNYRSPSPLGTPLGHASSIESVAFSPDGKTLASGSEDSTILLWDVSNPRSPVQLGTPLTGHTGTVDSVAFSPDGKTLASGSVDRSIILWNVSNPRAPVPQGTSLMGDTSGVNCVAFSPNRKTLASSNLDGTVILWDISNLRSPVQLGTPLPGHTNPVVSVAFSPDGQTLASGSDKSIILWNLTTRQRLGEPLIGHSDLVDSVAFSPDGKTLASGSRETIILWDVSNPRWPVQLGTPLTGHTGAAIHVAFSPDIILWNVSDPRLPVQLGTPLTGHTASVDSVAFSPDGKTLASGDGADIILWNVSNPQLPVQLGTPLTGHTASVDSFCPKKGRLCERHAQCLTSLQQKTGRIGEWLAANSLYEVFHVDHNLPGR